MKKPFQYHIELKRLFYEVFYEGFLFTKHTCCIKRAMR